VTGSSTSSHGSGGSAPRHVVAARVLEGVRAGVGLVLLSVPRRVLVLVDEDPRSRGARGFVLVLALRHLAQAAIATAVPAALGAGVGAGVDAAHAGTVVPWGMISARHRRAAFTNGAVAGAFAVAGLLVARSVDRPR